MNLMVVFRKYKTRIMAIVVVGLMIVFTIEPLMNYLSSLRGGGRNIVATYGQGKKVTNEDLAWAQKQLDILNTIGVTIFLRPQNPQMYPGQDLRLAVLGELLFTERGTAGETINYLKLLVRNNNYPVSETQINEIYSKTYPADMYWLMLLNEAQAAGVRIQPEIAQKQLESLIPKLHQGVTYPQFASAVMSKQQISQEQLVDTFADLMSVIEYSRTITSTQDQTARQILYEMSYNREVFDINYVQIPAKAFVDETKKPDNEQVNAQFSKYKGFYAGQVNETNPYGFGYKQPDSVQFEYIAVRLNDVAATVPPVTQQESEDYYQQHLQSSAFYRQELSDPNDPNSPMKEVLRSYAEVATVLNRHLYQQKIDSKAELILQEAKSISEANQTGVEDEQNKITDEQIKQNAVDYGKIAGQLSEKYKIKVYSGTTGRLSAVDIQSDKELGPLYLERRGLSAASILRLAFAVEPLKDSVLGPFDPKPPRLYQDIGPLQDYRELSEGYADKNMMLVRVIGAFKTSEPVSIDQKIDKRTVLLDQNTPATEANSVRDLVVKDLRLLAAMDVAKKRAEEFSAMTAKDGWSGAASKFNSLYTTKAEAADSFKIQSRSKLQRIPDTEIETLAIVHGGDPLANALLDRTKTEKMLLDKLYAIAADANDGVTAGTIIKCEQFLSFYCIENLKLHRLYQNRYETSKAMEIARDDSESSQAMAFVQFNPANIFRRTNFKLTHESARTSRSSEANDINTTQGPR